MIHVYFKAYDELYEGCALRKENTILYRLAKLRHQSGKAVQQVRMMKDTYGKVLTDEENPLRIWKEQYEVLHNEENERDG